MPRRATATPAAKRATRRVAPRARGSTSDFEQAIANVGIEGYRLTAAMREECAALARGDMTFDGAVERIIRRATGK